MWWKRKQEPEPVSPVGSPEGEEEESQEEALLCAWCLAEQGVTSVDGSHGICPYHAQQMVMQAEMRRERRRRGF